jgi:hypothetical protein
VERAILAVVATVLLLVWFGAGIAIGAAMDGDNDNRPTSLHVCDWETELFDGHECLSRTNHEAHTGH